jgi:hypothetical protein
MTSASTARGNAPVEIITWITMSLAAIILIIWYIKSGAFNPNNDITVADKDLLQLQLMLDEACSTDTYTNAYNPMSESGKLVALQSEVCIILTPDPETKITRCGTPSCELGSAEIDLAAITSIYIVNNGSVLIYGT